MKLQGKRADDWQSLLDTVGLRQGGRVVVAGEDPERRRTIALALGRDGHQVREARAPLELLAQLQITGPSLRHPVAPDVLVLDLSGSRWATLELLEIIDTGEVPLVVLVPPGASELAERVRQRGAQAVLELPVEEGAVRAEIMNLVQPPEPWSGAS